jgi:hypothetical protein
MFAEAFHSMIKGIYLILEVKTSFSNSTPATDFSTESNTLKPGLALTAVNGFTERREEDKPAHKKL